MSLRLIPLAARCREALAAPYPVTTIGDPAERVPRFKQAPGYLFRRGGDPHKEMPTRLTIRNVP